MTLNEDPNYEMSDLNNKFKLTDISRNLVKNMGRKLGRGVRFGMIKRFARRHRVVLPRQWHCEDKGTKGLQEHLPMR